MKRAVLVNGVPASGKSTVARAVSAARGWPLLTLDTVKEPFFDEIGVGDREHNRALGRASYRAIWSLVADFPQGSTVVVDAWFGFQPLEVLDAHLARAGVTAVAEIYCHASPDLLAWRYEARLDERHPGHPGAAYIPELIALAGRATATGRYPLLSIETTTPLDLAAALAFVDKAFD